MKQINLINKWDTSIIINNKTIPVTYFSLENNRIIYWSIGWTRQELELKPDYFFKINWIDLEEKRRKNIEVWKEIYKNNTIKRLEQEIKQLRKKENIKK